MAGKTITCRAAVAWGPKKPLVIEEIQVAPPQAGELRIRIKYTSLCHTDVVFLELEEGIFPRILGHEGVGIVESVGEGVTDLKEGDHVIPLYNGECGKCKVCSSDKSNLCEQFKADLWQSVMPGDQRTRFYKDGQPIYHFMSTSTFSEFTVVDYPHVVKINPAAVLENMCVLGCGVTTGIGAALNTAKVESGSTVAIFGLGSVGLAVAEGARIAGASRIIGIDINPRKFENAHLFGVTECINPKDHQKPIEQVLQEKTDGGADYAFECIGNASVMKSVFESVREGWGKAILIGLESPGIELCIDPFQFLMGKQMLGTAFGGYKGKTQLPGLVDMCVRKELNVEKFITHRLPLEQINEALGLLHGGESLRCVLDL